MLVGAIEKWYINSSANHNLKNPATDVADTVQVKSVAN